MTSERFFSEAENLHSTVRARIVPEKTEVVDKYGHNLRHRSLEEYGTEAPKGGNSNTDTDRLV